MTERYKGINLDDLIERGEADPSAIISETDSDDKARRDAEPDAYALTYDEAVLVRRAFNIFNLLLLLQERANADIGSGFSAKVIDTLDANDVHADDLLDIARRVFSANWYTIRLVTMGVPVENNLRQEVYGSVNGKQFQRVATTTADWRAYDPTSSVTATREQLNLPPDTKYLYQMECETLEIIRYLFHVSDNGIIQRVSLAPYAPMPNAPVFMLVSRYINDPHMAKKPRSKEDIEFSLSPDNDHELTISVTNGNTTSRFVISDYTQFLDFSTDGDKKNKRRGTLDGVKKVWRYTLRHLLKQSHNRTLPECVIIDLNDMVHNKMYSTVDNAYRGIETMYSKMSLIRLGRDTVKTTKDENGKPKKVKDSDEGITFFHIRREGGYAYLYVNKQLGYSYYANQYAYFPTWADSLTGNAYSIVEYIFHLMRMNPDILNKGKFKIMLDTLQAQIGIKSVDEVREKHNRRYADFIKKPIAQAVDDINAAAKADKEIAGKFSIALKVPDTTNIDVWVTTGYIEVKASGEYTDYLKPIVDGRELYATTYKKVSKEKKITRAATKRAKAPTPK